VETENRAVTPLGVKNAIGTLDVNSISGFGQDKTLATLSESDGKIAATFQSILVDTANIANDAVTADKVKDGATFPVNISGDAATASDAKPAPTWRLRFPARKSRPTRYSRFRHRPPG
jgi:hypothetical protein